MNTFEASVRVQVKGAIHIVRTEVRAPSAQDARWLLWVRRNPLSDRETKSSIRAVPLVGVFLFAFEIA